MRSFLRCLTLLLLVVCCSTVTAWADDLDVNVSSGCPPVICSGTPYILGFGSAAEGTADFNPLVDWTFSFLTADPISWNYNPDGMVYTASFGQGGSFQMTGPGGATFTGEVDSGSAFEVTGHSYSNGETVNFSGKWNNGLDLSGTATVLFSEGSGFGTDLTVNTTPEPTSLALFGSGVAGIWSVVRRRMRR
jgi:hypothetical protein